MKSFNMSSRKMGWALGILVGGGIAALGIQESVGSDHVDTAEVELSPTLDLNDVYVFPGSTDGRIVLAMDVASPINALGRNVKGFDPNAVYMFKIDNNGDAKEDLVLQFLFDEMSDGTQRVNVLGPAAPVAVPGDASGMLVRLVSSPVTTNQPFNATFTTTNGIQTFAGPRNDPFYLDFEKFIQILPDRRPASFLTGVATDAKMPSAFCGSASPFDTSCAPKDFFTGANSLSIVVEMPETLLAPAAGAAGKLGIWATISR